MNGLYTFIQGETGEMLINTLLHSIWQGTLIAGFLYLCLRQMKNKQSNGRYGLSVLGLGAVIVCAFITYAVLAYPATSSALHTEAGHGQTPVSLASDASDDVSVTSAWANTERPSPGVPARATPWQGYALCAWLLGAVVMLGRALCLILGAGRARQLCQPVDEPALLGLVDDLCKRLHLRCKITIAAGEHIVIPGVVGFLKPTILLPLSMVTAIPTEDLHAILAHELAHIKRYDYLINIGQMIIEAVLFFNPAVWWMSRQIRIEREACCDIAGVKASGEALAYAQVLTHWAEKVSSPMAHPPTAAMLGLSGPAQPRHLVDRVKRILLTDYQPRIRLAWYSALIMLTLSGLIGFSLWQGASTAVGYVGQWLSPQERVEAIVEIQQEYKPIGDRYDPNAMITVSGTVRTWDKQALPNNWRMLHGVSRHPNSSASYGLNLKDGAFSQKMQYGKIMLIAQADGYAPAFAWPLEARPGERIENVELVLEQGFTTQLRIVDPNKRPIQGAALSGGYIVMSNHGSGVALGTVTDANGMAELAHCTECKLRIRATVPGFQYDEKVFDLEPGKRQEWILTPARLTSGVLVSEDTGQPIAGATFGLSHCEGGPFHQGSDDPYHNRTILASSDAQGRFELASLRDDTRYFFRIDAPGHAVKFPFQIRAGQQDLRIASGQALYCQGKIIGPLERLSSYRDRVYMSYDNPWSYGSDSGKHSYPQNYDVDIRDGVAWFKIEGLWPGPLTLYAGGKQLRLHIKDKPIEDVVIDLNSDSAERRPVRVTFTCEGKQVFPQGKLTGNCNTDGKSISNKYQGGDLKDGVARLTVPVPCTFNARCMEVVGYWFGNVGLKVPAGQDEYSAQIEAIPAGSVFGNLLRPDGSLEDYDDLHIQVLDPAPGLKDRDISYEVFDHRQGNNGKFTGSPIPLGGKYVIVASRKYTKLFSPPFVLNQQNSIYNCDLQLKQPVTIQGRVRRPDGTPAYRANVELRLLVKQYDMDHGFLSMTTDEEGRFAFHEVNADAPGKYLLEIDGGPGYQLASRQIKRPEQPIEWTLKSGYTVKGIVLDDKTGWPIPNVTLYVRERFAIGRKDNTPSDSPTDDRGEFVFSRLGKRAYMLNYMNDLRTADSEDTPTFTGGQKEPVVIRASIPEWSKHRAVKPPDQ
jgi:beta-lactamase regulating signal transducer with metallopeptidase domain